jgi:hypothetical protein
MRTITGMVATMTLTVALVSGMVLAAPTVHVTPQGMATGAAGTHPASSPHGHAATADTSDAVDHATTGQEITYPQQGSATFLIAPGSDPVIGATGRLLRFQVAVENGITNLDLMWFADLVDQVYADPRGWTAGGEWRLQRVGPGEAADFVVYLVTPATRDLLCQDGYDRYTSCRRGNLVVLNVARFVSGVPDYGAGIEVYREYQINHETGHRLGFGHELCPGAGQLAPVMQQQTLGLHGCVANAWPYPFGSPYHGRPGTYVAPANGRNPPPAS